MRVRAVVGLGANLGDRLATMRSAAKELGQLARLLATSRVYETAPIGPPQGDFLNAAALLECEERGLPALLEALLDLELRLGRVRAERWGPRAIDLDLLWAEGVVLESERLLLPHPRLAGRAFALLPLLELVPGAKDPRTGEPYVVPFGEVRWTGETL